MDTIMSQQNTSPKITVPIRFATLDDTEDLLALHLRSFTPEKHLAVRLGESYMRAVYRWFIASDETFTIVAEENGKILGFTTICDRSYNRPMLRATWSHALAALLKRPLMAFHRDLAGRFLVNVFRKRGVGEGNSSQEKDVAHLAFIAVSPEARGKGVGASILYFGKSETFKRNRKALRAGVYKQNIASIRMFSKCGFSEVLGIDTPKVLFMETPLDDNCLLE